MIFATFLLKNKYNVAKIKEIESKIPKIIIFCMKKYSAKTKEKIPIRSVKISIFDLLG